LTKKNKSTKLKLKHKKIVKMKRKVFSLLTSFVLIFGLLTFTSAVSAQIPFLVIESPKSGEVINTDEALIRFKVTNFAITDFRRNKTPSNGQGHLHFWIDQTNPTPQNAIEHISTQPYLLTKLEPKEHTLIVELVGNDHNSLTPKVIQKVTFRTTGKPKTEGMITIIPLKTQPAQTAASGIGAVIIIVGFAIIIAITASGIFFYQSKLKKGKKSKVTQTQDQE